MRSLNTLAPMLTISAVIVKNSLVIDILSTMTKLESVVFCSAMKHQRFYTM